jgi:hypothetical protein
VRFWLQSWQKGLICAQKVFSKKSSRSQQTQNPLKTGKKVHGLNFFAIFSRDLKSAPSSAFFNVHIEFLQKRILALKVRKNTYINSQNLSRNTIQEACSGFQELSDQIPLLKGHGNEADFLGFLQKLVPHRSLTLPFQPFRFWLRIRGDNGYRKMTPLLGESATLRLGESGSRLLNV